MGLSTIKGVRSDFPLTHGLTHRPPPGPPAGPDGGGEFAFIHEEHLGFRFSGGAPYRVGDRAALIPTYAPTTVNLFGAFQVAEAGQIVDVWPVLARHGDT